MTEAVDMQILEFEDGISKAIEFFKGELSTIRAGRANPKILDKITVDYYGTQTPLNQMSNISVPEARMLLISVWDISQVKPISKAIEAANLGVNPSDDGKVIRLVFPPLTEERRKELCFEGQRWFDLRRYGMPSFTRKWGELTYKLEEKDRSYTMPIPNEVLDKNMRLEQNPLAPKRSGSLSK